MMVQACTHPPTCTAHHLETMMSTDPTPADIKRDELRIQIEANERRIAERSVAAALANRRAADCYTGPFHTTGMEARRPRDA